LDLPPCVAFLLTRVCAFLCRDIYVFLFASVQLRAATTSLFLSMEGLLRRAPIRSLSRPGRFMRRCGLDRQVRRRLEVCRLCFQMCFPCSTVNLISFWIQPGRKERRKSVPKSSLKHDCLTLAHPGSPLDHSASFVIAYWASFGAVDISYNNRSKYIYLTKSSMACQNI
jgi:hypothetical protein